MEARRAVALALAVGALLGAAPASGQTEEELLAIHAAQLAAMNAHDLDTMMSYWADDGVYDLVPSPPPAPVEYVRMSYASIFANMPDFRMTEGRTLAAGNVVVEESTTVRTNPQTGIEVISPHLSIYDFEGNKIKRVTSYKDNLSDMVQLGQMPAPEMPELTPSVTVPDAEPTGLSPLEANAELIRRWNSHDAGSVAKMDHADVQIYADPLGMHIDRVAMMALNEMYFTSFPDDELEVVRAIDLGDGWVLTELVSHATHQQTFMGVPASGYRMEVRVVWLTQYDADGLVAEMSFYYDNLTLINQMTTAPFPLDGIWITSAPTPFGNWVSKTLYVGQDATKTRFGGTLEFINAFPLMTELYPDYDPSLSFSAGGQAAMVGRNKYEATFLGFSRKIDRSTGTIEIVGIDTLSAHFEVVGADRIQGQGTASYYMAAQDADQDGFPDDGQEPVACFPWSWTSRRLTTMPGCVPTP